MPPDDDYPNGSRDWREDRKLVLHELSRLSNEINQLRNEELKRDRSHNTHFADLRADIVMLKTKASLWGGGVGIIAGALASAFISLVFGQHRP